MKKILIVDDEPNFLTLLGRTLTEEGYQVTTASTSAEAITIGEDTVFDTLITEIISKFAYHYHNRIRNH
jgi:DNA-binding response OmpR family regulator